MSTTDLSYITDGMFTTILPNTPAGEKVWNEFASQNGGDCKFLTAHKNAVIAQLTQAGYTIRESKPNKSTENDVDLLASLGISI